MNSRTTFYTVITTLALLVSASINIAETSTVKAASWGSPCNPQRANDYLTYRFDGWEYPEDSVGATTVLGGASVDLTAYPNYSVPHDSNLNNDGDYAYEWSMLTDDEPTSTNRLAQIGLITGQILDSSDYQLEDYTYNVSGQNNAYIAVQILPGQQLAILNTALSPGTGGTFRVDYNRTTAGTISFYYDNTTTPLYIPQYQGSYFNIVSSSSPYYWDGYLPTQIQIMGESHSLAYQMFGDAATPETFANSQYWNNGWLNINNPVGQARGFISTTSYGQAPEASAPQSYLNIWDEACPARLMAFAGQGSPQPLILEDTSGGSYQSPDTMASGSSPSIAQLSDGSYAVAFQGTDGDLCIYTTANGATNCTNLGMSTPAPSSPAIAGISTGGYIVAFRANTDQLCLYTSGGQFTNTGLGMMSNTNPAIASTSGGGWVAAFQANTGYLYTYQNGAGYDEGLGMQSGTSPAMTSTSSGGWELAFEANTQVLYWFQPSGASTNTQQGMDPSTSPSMSQLSDGEYVAAFTNSSDYLNYWLSGSPTSSVATGDEVLGGTSPGVVGTLWFNIWIDFQNPSNEVSVFSNHKALYLTGKYMQPGTSPAISE